MSAFFPMDRRLVAAPVCDGEPADTVEVVETVEVGAVDVDTAAVDVVVDVEARAAEEEVEEAAGAVEDTELEVL